MRKNNWLIIASGPSATYILEVIAKIPWIFLFSTKIRHILFTLRSQQHIGHSYCNVLKWIFIKLVFIVANRRGVSKLCHLLDSMVGIPKRIITSSCIRKALQTYGQLCCSCSSYDSGFGVDNHLICDLLLECPCQILLLPPLWGYSTWPSLLVFGSCI